MKISTEGSDKMFVKSCSNLGTILSDFGAL